MQAVFWPLNIVPPVTVQLYPVQVRSVVQYFAVSPAHTVATQVITGPGKLSITIFCCMVSRQVGQAGRPFTEAVLEAMSVTVYVPGLT